VVTVLRKGGERKEQAEDKHSRDRFHRELDGRVSVEVGQ
jgi:hypothetical protein